MIENALKIRNSNSLYIFLEIYNVVTISLTRATRFGAAKVQMTT